MKIMKIIFDWDYGVPSTEYGIPRKACEGFLAPDSPTRDSSLRLSEGRAESSILSLTNEEVFRPRHRQAIVI